MEKEQLIQALWKMHQVKGRKCPRNHVAISCGLKEALLDMRTFRYSDKLRYSKALKTYNSLCKERDERTHMEELADKILACYEKEQKPEILVCIRRSSN